MPMAVPAVVENRKGLPCRISARIERGGVAGGLINDYRRAAACQRKNTRSAD
jgi:hypothetical protein